MGSPHSFPKPLDMYIWGAPTPFLHHWIRTYGETPPLSYTTGYVHMYVFYLPIVVILCVVCSNS